MKKSFKRTDRVSSELNKQLSIILQREIKTDRLGMVSVSDISISPDLMYAKAYVTFLDVGASEQLTVKEKLAELSKQTPYIRSLIAKRMLLRIIPEITFIYDDSADKYNHINRLLKEVE